MNVVKMAVRFLIRHWLLLSLLAILAYVLWKQVNYSQLLSTFAGVSWLFVGLAILANLASILLKVASWKIIFDFSFKKAPARWRDLTSALMIGFLVNALVPARMGELARAYVISRRQSISGQRVSRSTVFGTIVLERVFDGFVLAMIIIYGVTRMNLPGWADRGAIVLLAVAVFFGAALILLEAKRESIAQSAAAAAASHREHHSWWKKQMTRLKGIVARFSEGQQVLRSPGRVITILGTTTASWMSQLTAVFMSLNAFHLGFTGFLGAVLLLILINVAGALPATPGNVGIFQLATVIPLAIAYGSAPAGQPCLPDFKCINESTALAFSIGLQAIEGSIGLGVGSAFLLREGLNLKQVKRESIRKMEGELR